MEFSPSREQFCSLAAEHNIIPVYTELDSDLETPVSVYYKLVGENRGFMLESADTGKSFGRYSFIGTQPFMTISATKSALRIERDTAAERLDGPPLAALQSVLDGFFCPAMPDLPPFAGGAVGYLNYEAVATFERVRGMSLPEDLVLGEFMLCRIIVALDHLTHSAKLIYLAPVKETDAAAAYDQAVQALSDLAAALEQPAVLPETEKPPRTNVAKLPDDEQLKSRYLANVKKAKEYIAAGDIFQVVLSHSFRFKLEEEPFALYRRLRRVNPSPYMFYINFGQRRLVGASPEMLVKLQNGKVFTCPIAGTRPRGKDAAEDARLAAELSADTKELAEHAMLVDLGRNDIGRVSQPGTVAVSRLMQVEHFSHVMHLVSEVTGTLDPRFKPTDALAACFPAGTVSGAPKVRAMEIINELERQRRGPYAGAVGYFDFRGNMDTCITIRTMAIKGDEVVIQSGGGIVADSVPELEYQETLHKARAMFRVLGGE